MNRLNPSQRDVLEGVRDATRMIDEAGLYVLLDQAEHTDSAQLAREAAAVHRSDLVSKPETYRGRLVKLNACYAETRSFRPSNRRRYDRVAYSTLAWERDSLEPVSIVTVDDPGRLRKMAHVVLAGYFLKLRLDERRAPDPKTGSREVLVPVLVGRAIVRDLTASGAKGPGPISSAGLVVGGVLLMAALWIIMRVRLTRKRGGQDGGGARRRAPPPSADDPDAPENRPIDLSAWETGPAQGPVTDQAAATGRETEPAACPDCGAPNRSGARFCDQCGVPLGDQNGCG